MKHFGDITKIKGNEVPLVDIVCGGSPCQDLSIAGKRLGMQHSDLGDSETTRSGLFMEQIRIIKEMHDECRRTNKPLRPRYMLWENVCGVFSLNGGETFRAVLEETARIADSSASIPRLADGESWSNSGCILADRWSIAWRVHSAEFWGCPQRRYRVSLIADFRGQTAPEILFERESVQRNTQESGEERQDSADSSQRGIGTICFCEREGKDGGVKEYSPNTSEPEHSRSPIIKQSANCEGVDLFNQAVTGDVSMSITGAATDPHHIPCVISESENETKAITFSQDAYDEYSENDSSATLKQSGGVYGGGSESLVIQ